MSEHAELNTENAHDEALLEALAVGSGVVCFTGAGGKKTTLYRLALAYPGRVGVTATVHVPYFPAELGAWEVIEEPQDLLAGVVSVPRSERIVAFASPSQKRGRWAGVPPDLLEPIRVQAGLDVILVKADGARSRLINAGSAKEPPLPSDVTTVVRVLAIRAVGYRLDEKIAHRCERIAEICGMAPGDPIAAIHLVRLLTWEAETLVPSLRTGVRFVAQLNMVDDPHQERLARGVAEAVLKAHAGYERVVLTRASHRYPLVDVVKA